MWVDNFIIDKRLHHLLGDGAEADVFQVQDRAFKLFKDEPASPIYGTPQDAFRSQCEAYQIASDDCMLRLHIPTFYGRCVIEDVIDEAGTSIKERYLLECCYQLEVCDYKLEAKILASEVQRFAHMKPIIDQFRALNINAVDASVFDYANPDRFKVFDFRIMNWRARGFMNPSPTNTDEG